MDDNELPDGSRKRSGPLDYIDNCIARIEEVIMAVGVILMAVNTITNVISRFVFNHSIVFAEELNSIFILLVTFADVGYAARHARHIRMSAIYDHLPFWWRKALMTIITGITGLILLFLSWYAVEYILNLQAKGRIYPALGIPVYVSYLWVPVGFFISGLQYILTFLKNIREKEIYLSTDLHEQDAEVVEV